MAITRGATITTFTSSSTGTARSFSHTVDASTTLLFIVIDQRADIDITADPIWNTSENFTLIHEAIGTPGGGNMVSRTYGLINPTATTANITYTQDSDNQTHCTAVNYLGTETSSLAVATNFISEDVNDGATSTTVLSSGGSSGNALIGCAGIVGGDASPASDDSGGAFNELANSNTGATGTNDTSFYVADLLAGLPDGLTITWSVSDQNAGQLIELVAGGGGGVTGHPQFYRRRMMA